MSPMDTQTIIADIQSALQNLSFPARKQEVIDHAHMNGARGESIDLLRELPNQKFNSVQDLISQLPLGNVDEQIDDRIDDFL